MKIKSILWSVLIVGFLIMVPTTSTTPIALVDSAVLAQSDYPLGRYLPGFVYDPVNDRIMMFGGSNDVDLYDDTWVLNTTSGTWTELSLSVSPIARHSCVMVYDSSAEVIILFGGHNGTAWDSDTWIFDCNQETWTEVTPAISPHGRGSAAMVYDSLNDKVLLFSGYSESGPDVSDTWAYDYISNTWEEMSPDVSPHARYGAAYTYDTENESMLLFGGNSNGYFSDTWSYDYSSDTWTEMNPVSHPPALKWSQMVYDSNAQKSILFGGDNVLSRAQNETWIYDSSINDWVERQPTIAPPAKEAFGFAYDPVAEKAVLFGGTLHTPDTFNDTWAYDYTSNTWEEIGVPSVPSTIGSDVWLILTSVSAVGIVLVVILLLLKRYR